MATLASAQFESGLVYACASAHAAPLICQPCVAVEPRFARGARAAGSRQHHNYAGVYAVGLSAFGAGLRLGASAGS